MVSPSKRERDDAALTAGIKTVHEDSKERYGAPRVHAELRAPGKAALPQADRPADAPGRAARQGGKAVKRRPPSPTRPQPPGPTASGGTSPPTPRRPTPAGAVTSPTSPTWEGWLYLATVIDIASRRVVGYAMADHLRTELVSDALANAVAARDPEPGVIFHSDRGCQYTSAAYAVLAADCQVTLSVGRTGQCWDNALAESFFSSLKGGLRRHPRLAHPGGRPAGGRGVHRLVQRHPAAFLTRISQPRPIRKRPPRKHRASSLT